MNTNKTLQHAFCWQSRRVPTYIRLCVLFCLFVCLQLTETRETSTNLCGNAVHMTTIAVHMYAGWIANCSLVLGFLIEI